SITRTQAIDIPFSLNGQRFVIVQTDATGQVFEHALEQDNLLADDRPMTIQQPLFPNLQVSDVSAQITNVELNQAIEVTWNVDNVGSGATSASFWLDRVYLSVDQTFDGTDVFLGQRGNLSFLNSGESYASSLVVS